MTVLHCWIWPHENAYEQPAAIERPWTVSKTWRKRLACWKLNSSCLLHGEEITKDKMDIQVRQERPADKQHPRKLSKGSHFWIQPGKWRFFATLKCLLSCGLQKCWSMKSDGWVSYRTRGSARKRKPRGTLWLQSQFPHLEHILAQCSVTTKEMSERQQMNKVSGSQFSHP